MSNRRLALVEAGTIVGLLAAGAVGERARNGVELLYLAFAVLMLAPLVRSWLVARDRIDPAPGVLRAITLIASSGLLVYPCGRWAHAGAGLVTLLLALPFPYGSETPRRGATYLEEAFVLALAIGALTAAWLTGRTDPGIPVPLVLLGVFALETYGPLASRGAHDVARRAAGLSLVGASALIHHYEPLPLAEPLLLVLASLAAAPAVLVVIERTRRRLDSATSPPASQPAIFSRLAPLTLVALLFAALVLVDPHGPGQGVTTPIEPTRLGFVIVTLLCAVSLAGAVRPTSASASGLAPAPPPYEAPSNTQKPHSRLTAKKRVLFAATLVLLLAGLSETASWLVYERSISRESRLAFQKLLDRTMGGGYFSNYRPHPYTCFDLNPDYETPSGRWNSKDGFRLPEMARAHGGAFRIAAVGGSTTYEPDMPLENTYVAYLEEYLNRRFPTRKIEILNAGMGAANSADNFGRFHFKVLDYSPDMIVNYDGINDLWPMFCQGPFENDLRHARKVMEPYTPPSALASFLCQHTWTFRALYFGIALKGQIPHVMDITYKHIDMTEETYRQASPSAFIRDLENTAFICKARGVELVLSTFAADDFFNGRDPKKDPYALLVRGVDDLNPIVKDLAAKLDVPLLDLDRLMPRNDKVRPVSEHYFVDVCHTTVRGNLVRANLAGGFLAKRLEKRFGVAAEPFEFDTSAREGYPPALLRR